MEKGYKEFLKTGKKVSPSGSGSASSSTNKSELDVYKIMSFLDDKFRGRDCISSAGKLLNNDQGKIGKSSIWDSVDCHLAVEEVEEIIVPEPSTFHQKKRSKSNNDFKESMQGIFSCVKDLTGIMRDNLKSYNPDVAYHQKINNFFTDLSEKQRDELMLILLDILSQ